MYHVRIAVPGDETRRTTGPIWSSGHGKRGATLVCLPVLIGKITAPLAIDGTRPSQRAGLRPGAELLHDLLRTQYTPPSNQRADLSSAAKKLGLLGGAGVRVEIHVVQRHLRLYLLGNKFPAT
jgi:hypothetical protein